MGSVMEGGTLSPRSDQGAWREKCFWRSLLCSGTVVTIEEAISMLVSGVVTFQPPLSPVALPQRLRMFECMQKCFPTGT